MEQGYCSGNLSQLPRLTATYVLPGSKLLSSKLAVYQRISKIAIKKHTQPSLHRRRLGPTQNPRPTMSSFFSSEAERALAGEEEEAQRLFNETLNEPIGHPQELTGTIPYDAPQWGLMPRAPRANLMPRTPEELHDYSFESQPDSELDREPSPSPQDMHNYGFLNQDGRTWRCAYPGCTSRATFVRGCDLRKHYRRHAKPFFCRRDGCAQASERGFSSKKDRDRHEAKHNPGVPCEWEGCDRVFSRVDNMKDHVRRIHRKGNASVP
ncbi:hypothetical protein MMC20_004513 [Loxospora ochrophaea]|nr:hypothetical protein [Loxospora ochrophaea]